MPQASPTDNGTRGKPRPVRGPAIARKKPRLFSFSREIEIANFEEVVLDAGERRALVAIVDAFLEICRTQHLTPETLAPIADGARFEWPHVRGVAITRLTVLTHYFPEAVPALASVCRDPDEEVRLYGVAALPNTPDEVATPLLEASLADVSWRVRKAAAVAAAALASPSLGEALARRLCDEPDARVKVQLQLALDYLGPGASG